MNALPMPDPDSPLDFVWTRWQYAIVSRRLQDVEHTIALVLVDRLDSEATAHRPLLEFPMLYRVFADTCPTPEGILAFAHRYGRLGSSMAVPVLAEYDAKIGYWDLRPGPQYKQPTVPPEHTLLAEPVFAWRDAIARIAHLSRLWDLAGEPDKRTLAKYVKWSGDTITVTCPTPSPDFPRGAWGLLPLWRCGANFSWNNEGVHRHGDLIGPVQHFVQEAIRQEMDRSPTKVHLLWRRHAHRAALFLWPQDLWGAMLLQFAQTVEGTNPVRRCLGCGKWFKLGAGQDPRRADARVCSDTCRVRAHRAKSAALEMKAKRKSIGRIAAELNRDPAVIREWLSTNKRKGN
jgi:hypothetical protein